MLYYDNIFETFTALCEQAEEGQINVSLSLIIPLKLSK